MAKDINTGECLDHCPENTFLTSKGVCKESFEINGNELTGPKEIDFDTDMPRMSELTVSFWVQLSGTKVPTPGIYFYSDARIYLDFVEYEHSPSGLAFRVWMFSGVTAEFYWRWPQEFMANPTWHLLSTTWSGMNRVLRVFVDGERESTWEYSGVQSFSGGGRFGLDVPQGKAFPIRVTSINMWNHVLSDEVITAHVKSCDAAIGNIKEWYDAWPILEEQSALYTKPATCSAPIPNPSYSEGVASEDDLHLSSGKALFTKNKKEKSSTKVGRKTHN